MTIKQLKQYFYVSNGNKKLKNNEKLQFLIWNIPAITTCPFATKECIKNCYAKKAEKQYLGCRSSREKNLQFSKSENFIHYMNEYIKEKEKRSKKEILFRIHESGDFYSKNYVEKWIKIAKLNPNVTFLAYTKSIEYFKDLKLPDNFVLRFSVWKDTPLECLEIAKDMNLPIYMALEKHEDFSEYFKCRCRDCGTCKACYTNKVKRIACEIH